VLDWRNDLQTSMKLNDLQSQKLKLKPCKDLVAFIWVKPAKTNTGLVLPQNIFELRMEPGRYLLGRIIATGPKVRELKPGEYFIFSEYAMRNYEGSVKEDWVYFIREKDIHCKVENPDPHVIDYRPQVSETEKKKMQEE